MQRAAISGAYTAAPALAWTGGGGQAMDTNANGTPIGNGVWSAWRWLWLQNTGNTGVWMGDGIVADTWDRVASWGTHTCQNRWLWPGETCFRDVAHLYTTNEWIGRSHIVWGHSANPGQRGLWGQAFNYRQPTWQWIGDGWRGGSDCAFGQWIEVSQGQSQLNSLPCGSVGQVCTASQNYYYGGYDGLPNWIEVNYQCQ